MSYWPQQLNFAVWGATTGWGISRQILFELNFSPQLRSFYPFHVHFTIRRILFEMGGIQSVSALPRDSRLTTTTASRLIIGFAKSLESTPAAISATKVAKTMA